MTDVPDIVNLAFQSFGDRTTITAAQLTANSNNQAKQANLTYANTRDSLLRMAPWNCAFNVANLTYISSIPGTPENTSAATNLWQKGQPYPPWAYEYQYPVDCLRACYIIPSTQTGFAGIPITTAVTGGASSAWLGRPIPYKIGIDQFWTIATAHVVAGGAGYLVNDVITLAAGPTTSPPIGAPAQLFVLAAPGGVISSVSVINQIAGQATPQGGSYFNFPSGTIAQGSTTGNGTGATFTVDVLFTKNDQRVIFTNQEFATLAYVRQVTDPNVWDSIFQDALVNALGGDICLALTGDKGLANMCIARANNSIMEARKADGNEGLTINDVTPDWIRGRGINWSDGLMSGPYSGFDWGGLLPNY